MKKFIAGKDAVVELAETVNKLTADSTEPYGVFAIIEGEDFTVTEILFIEPDTVSFRYLPKGVESLNVLLLSNGHSFLARVDRGHATGFRGI